MRNQQQIREETETCDRELLSRARDGDMFAFERLVERHRDQVYGFALRITRSETAAADIAQESFLSAYCHLNEFQNENEFGAWIRWIAASHASIRLRPLRKAQAAEWKLESPMFHARGGLPQCSRADWSRDADTRPLSDELRRSIEDATERLPQSHREVFLLRDIAGLSYEQIAGISGESVPAIKSRLHQARLSLRETIDRFYSETPRSVET